MTLTPSAELHWRHCYRDSYSCCLSQGKQRPVDVSPWAHQLWPQRLQGANMCCNQNISPVSSREQIAKAEEGYFSCCPVKAECLLLPSVCCFYWDLCYAQLLFSWNLWELNIFMPFVLCQICLRAANDSSIIAGNAKGASKWLHSCISLQSRLKITVTFTSSIFPWFGAELWNLAGARDLWGVPSAVPVKIFSNLG